MTMTFRAEWLKPLLITPTCGICGSDLRHTGQVFESPAGKHAMHACTGDATHPPSDFPVVYPRVHFVPSRDATPDELVEIEL
jgi:hypothetical protein